MPYLILAIAYQVWKHKFDPAVLLLLGNFQPLDVQLTNNIFFVWFIANLIQIILLLSLLLSIPVVRSFAKASPWRFGTFSLGIGVTAHLLGPHIWDTSYLCDQVPHMLFWLVAFGWCIHFSRSRTERIATTVVILVLTPVLIGLSGLQGWWVLTGAVMLLWLPYVIIPNIIKSPVQTVSAASYYIYLTVLIFIHPVTDVLGIHHPVIITVLTLLGGVLTWKMVQTFQQFLANKRFRKLNHTESVQY